MELRARTLGLVIGLAGCTGSIDDPGALAPMGGPGAPTGGGPAGTGSAQGGGGGLQGSSSALTCSDSMASDPGPAPMRLLSRTQYLHTVHDLLGDVAQLSGALPEDNTTNTLGLAQGDVTQVQVEQYQTAAALIAAAIVGDANKLKSVAPCTGSDQRACASTFVSTFGARAYRAPIGDADDLERHLKLYDVGAKTSYAHGIELLLSGMLQSPRFLYRVEVGTGNLAGPAAVKLSGYEVAARLSYSLWDTLPDEALTSAAKNGQLATADGVAARLDTMLADPRGSNVLQRFLGLWLQLGQLPQLVKDGTAYPDWASKNLPSVFAAQANAFFSDVLQNQGGTLAALLTSPKVLVNQDMASYYGVTASGAAFTPMSVSTATSGVLSLPAFLAIQAKPLESSPVYRGKFIREQLFCQQLPAPPANVPKAPEVQQGVSTRERLAQHEVDPSCSGCHSLMDPIGFGLENFDAIGKWRTQDGAQAVDATGTINGADDANGAFDGVVQLGQRLASSSDVQDCMARQWFRFALGRFEQDDVDGCSLQSLRSAFAKSGQDLNELPKALLGTDAFLYRRPLDWKGSK